MGGKTPENIVISDGDSIYEIDAECLKRKKNKSRDTDTTDTQVEDTSEINGN